jgi:hypothetical protein
MINIFRVAVEDRAFIYMGKALELWYIVFEHVTPSKLFHVTWTDEQEIAVGWKK